MALSDGQPHNGDHVSNDGRVSAGISDGQSPLSHVAYPILIFVYILVVVGTAYFVSNELRALLIRFWWVVLLIAIPIVAAPSLPAARKWFREAKTLKRTAFVIFVVIPLIAAAVLLAELLGPLLQRSLVRILFFFSVCLFPASMYYLFIVSRRASLLSEYETQLVRLGLLERRYTENDRQYHMRRRSYWERFNSVYGFGPKSSGDGAGSERLEADSGDQGGIFSVETLIPIVGATVLIAIGWFITLPPLLGEALQPLLFDMIPIPSDAADPQTLGKMVTSSKDIAVLSNDTLFPAFAPVQFAFLGAYFFSIQMLFRRYVRSDLGANAYVGVSLRILLAVIAVWVAEKALISLNFTIEPSGKFRDEFLVFAFALGVFPRILWQLIKGVSKKFPGLDLALPSTRTAKTMEVSTLDGLTIWHETRLEEEDIESIPNMATADIVGLMLETQFPPNRIVDWVDQAILYRYVDDENVRKNLRQNGIRTASALLAIHDDEAIYLPDILENGAKPANGDPNGNGAGIGPVMPNMECLVYSIRQSSNLRSVQHWRRFGIEEALVEAVADELEVIEPPVEAPAAETDTHDTQNDPENSDT